MAMRTQTYNDNYNMCHGLMTISCPIDDTHLVSDMWGATYLNGASTSCEGRMKWVNCTATGTNMSALCFLKECKNVIFMRLTLYNKSAGSHSVHMCCIYYLMPSDFRASICHVVLYCTNILSFLLRFTTILVTCLVSSNCSQLYTAVHQTAALYLC